MSIIVIVNVVAPEQARCGIAQTAATAVHICTRNLYLGKAHLPYVKCVAMSTSRVKITLL